MWPPLPPQPQVNQTFTIPGYADLTVGIKYLNISGLDTITDLSILSPTSDHSLTTGISASSFNASIGVYINVDPIPGGAVQGGTLKEEFNLGLTLEDLQIFARLFLGVDAPSLSNLTVYQILNPNAHTKFHEHMMVDWTCALSTLWNATVTDLKTVLKLEDLYLHADDELKVNSLEAEVDKLVDDALSLFVGDYNELVTDSLAGIVQGPVRSLVNGLLDELVEAVEKVVVNDEPCTPPLDLNETGSEYLHFDESKVLTVLSVAVNTLLGVDGVNDALECTAEYVENKGWVKNWNFTYESGEEGPAPGLKVVVKDLKFGNVGNLYKFEVLKSEKDHYHLINDLGFADCKEKGDIHDPACSPFTVGATVHVEYPEYLVDDTLTLNVSLGDFGVNLGTSAFFSVSKFGSLPMKSLSNPQCMLSALDNFTLYSNEEVELGAFEAVVHAILTSKREEGYHR